MKSTSLLKPCNSEIYKNGKHIITISGGSAKLIQRFVDELADYSDQPIDWHYFGGTGVILTTGDVSKVREALMWLNLNVNWVADG